MKPNVNVLGSKKNKIQWYDIGLNLFFVFHVQNHNV